MQKHRILSPVPLWRQSPPPLNSQHHPWPNPLEVTHPYRNLRLQVSNSNGFLLRSITLHIIDAASDVEEIKNPPSSDTAPKIDLTLADENIINTNERRRNYSSKNSEQPLSFNFSFNFNWFAKFWFFWCYILAVVFFVQNLNFLK